MSQTLIAALQDPALYPHPVEGFQVIETHISWVILTGPYAYKIKKPMNFGFLDFSELADRAHFCAEELRLNQRLTSDLYLQCCRSPAARKHLCWAAKVSRSSTHCRCASSRVGIC